MDLNAVTVAGAHRVTFKGIDIGHTLDGITFRIGRTTTDVRVDQYGTTPIDKVLTGSSAEAVFKLAQDGFRQFQTALPEANPFDQAGTALDRLDFGRDAGFSFRGVAGTIVFHPLSRDTTDRSKDITLYLAASVGDSVELPLMVDAQKAMEVTMVAFPVETYGNGRRLGHIGNQDIS